MTGASCNVPNTVWNGKNCTMPEPVYLGMPLNRTIPADNSTLVFALYLFPKQSLVYNLTFSVTGEVELCVRFDTAVGTCVPTSQVKIPIPSFGKWLVFVTPKMSRRQLLQNTTFVITTTTDNCTSPDKGGVNCDIPINSIDRTTLTSNALTNNSVYYRVDATYPGKDFFWITVASMNGPAPQVYVSLFQIPTQVDYDLTGCNQQTEYCQNTIIKLNTTQLSGNYTFYVLIFTNSTTTYGIWASSICAPGCGGDNGVCTETGIGTGTCLCKNDYTGFTCSTAPPDTGLPAQYIVLIIIASLVVASAIIGFIAWAYMQKKRSGYDRVPPEGRS